MDDAGAVVSDAGAVLGDAVDFGLVDGAEGAVGHALDQVQLVARHLGNGQQLGARLQLGQQFGPVDRL